MPLVIVTANRSCPALSDIAVLQRFGRQLRRFVARALTCDAPGGELTDTDIEVDLEDRDPERNIGGEQYDLQIIVFANDFPSRKATLEERCQRLRYMIGKWPGLGNVRGYVWIRLAPAAFAEF